MTSTPPPDNSPAQEIEKAAPKQEQPSLHELLSRSPLTHLDFEQASVQSPVRYVDLLTEI
jgi:antitoxin Phd